MPDLSYKPKDYTHWGCVICGENFCCCAHFDGPVAMLPCPFCGGPPVVHLHHYKYGRQSLRYRILTVVKRAFGDWALRSLKGDSAEAHVFCHECGAQGSGVDGIVHDAADEETLRRHAIVGWNLRNRRNYDLFGANEDLNWYPDDIAPGRQAV